MVLPATPQPSTGQGSGQADSRRVASLQSYLLADPENLTLRADLCDELLAANQPDRMLDLMAPVLAQPPVEAAWRYRQGVALSRKGCVAEASAVLGEVVAEGIEAPPVLFELACLQVKLEQHEAAAELLEKLALADQYELTYPRVDYLLLRMLHFAGRVNDAIAHGERVLARDAAADAQVVGAMATLYIDANRMDAADHLLQAHGAEMPLAADVRAEWQSALGYVALNAEHYEVAQRSFEDSLKQTPDFGRSLLGLGMTCAVQGDVGRAEEVLQQAAQAMPTHLGTWHTLAWLQLARDDIDGAERTFEHVMGIDNTFAESHGGLAIIAALRGERERARELCKVALRLDRASLNAMAAQLILEHGSLKSPEFVKVGLSMLAKRPGFTLPKQLRSLL